MCDACSAHTFHFFLGIVCVYTVVAYSISQPEIRRAWISAIPTQYLCAILERTMFTFAFDINGWGRHFGSQRRKVVLATLLEMFKLHILVHADIHKLAFYSSISTSQTLYGVEGNHGTWPIEIGFIRDALLAIVPGRTTYCEKRQSLWWSLLEEYMQLQAVSDA